MFFIAPNSTHAGRTPAFHPIKSSIVLFAVFSFEAAAALVAAPSAPTAILAEPASAETLLPDLQRFRSQFTYIADSMFNQHAKRLKVTSRVKQQLKDKLIEHKQSVDQYGGDLPEIRIWKWGATNAGNPA